MIFSKINHLNGCQLLHEDSRYVNDDTISTHCERIGSYEVMYIGRVQLADRTPPSDLIDRFAHYNSITNGISDRYQCLMINV